MKVTDFKKEKEERRNQTGKTMKEVVADEIKKGKKYEGHYLNRVMMLST